MAAIEIHNTTEAKQRLRDAFDILDAISAYSNNHQLPSDPLFDKYKRLYPKPSPPIHRLLDASNGINEHDKEALSANCYKVEGSIDQFDDVLNGLEAYYKLMNSQSLVSKGEIIYTIIRAGKSKTIRSVAGILDVIGCLALWHIREVEARTVATQRGHKLISQEDKSIAASEMWQQLSAHNRYATRATLTTWISRGIRWNRFLGKREIGMIAAVHKLPHSLKFSNDSIDQLASIVADMPEIQDQAKKATPVIQKLLDTRLGPWTRFKQRQHPDQSVSELSLEHHDPDTEAVTTATQSMAHDQQRKRRRVNRGLAVTAENWEPTHDTFLQSNEDRELVVTAENPEDVCLQTGNTSLDSTISQGGRAKETTEDINVGAYQSQNNNQVIARLVARNAEVEKLRTTLGDYLYGGMSTSRKRMFEIDQRIILFTDTVRLYLAFHKGEDVKLEVWVSSSIGKAILQAKRGLVEHLRDMLGNYLFEHMKASKWRKEEESNGTSDSTDAVKVSFPNGDDRSDHKVEVMLDFVMGMSVFADLFPH